MTVFEISVGPASAVVVGVVVTVFEISVGPASAVVVGVVVTVFEISVGPASAVVVGVVVTVFEISVGPASAVVVGVVVTVFEISVGPASAVVVGMAVTVAVTVIADRTGLHSAWLGLTRYGYTCISGLRSTMNGSLPSLAVLLRIIPRISSAVLGFSTSTKPGRLEICKVTKMCVPFSVITYKVQEMRVYKCY